MPGYKANAKNTNNGAFFRYSGSFNFEEEHQRAKKLFVCYRTPE
jgi:hypothetical protein